MFFNSEVTFGQGEAGAGPHMRGGRTYRGGTWRYPGGGVVIIDYDTEYLDASHPAG